MTSSVRELQYQRNSALTAGISLIIMAFAAFFSYGYVHESIVVQGDVNATFNNILSSNMLFKAEILGWLIILILDIVVAWGFYIFLKPINKSLSLLGAWFRLVYSAVLGIAIMNLLFVLILSNSPDYISLNIDQVQALVMLFLEAFDVIWSVGLIIFGGHLLIVGYLTFKSNFIPKIISILLWIASIGYIGIHLSYTFLSQYDGVITIFEYIFTVPMILGELGFGIWLLVKGGKVPKNV